MGIFSEAKGQLTPQSQSNLAEIRTRAGYYGCPRYLQVCSCTEVILRIHVNIAFLCFLLQRICGLT